MALPAISKKEKFFIEGSGTARIYGDDVKSHLIYLQDMTLEITSSTEHVFNGVSDYSQYEYITEKSAKVSFTNASFNLSDVCLAQELPPDSEVFDFVEETLSANSEGVLTMSNKNIERDSFMVYDNNDVVVPILGINSGAGVCSLGGGYSNQTVTAAYNYIADSSTGISASIYTSSIPRFVMIVHRSKPILQKNDRYIRVITTIFKARSNGQWTFDLKHKTAFASELSFDIIDPNRADGRLMIFSIKDATKDEEDLQPAGGSAGGSGGGDVTEITEGIVNGYIPLLMLNGSNLSYSHIENEGTSERTTDFSTADYKNKSWFTLGNFHMAYNGDKYVFYTDMTEDYNEHFYGTDIALPSAYDYNDYTIRKAKIIDCDIGDDGSVYVVDADGAVLKDGEVFQDFKAIAESYLSNNAFFNEYFCRSLGFIVSEDGESYKYDFSVGDWVRGTYIYDTDATVTYSYTNGTRIYSAFVDDQGNYYVILSVDTKRVDLHNQRLGYNRNLSAREQELYPDALKPDYSDAEENLGPYTYGDYLSTTEWKNWLDIKQPTTAISRSLLLIYNDEVTTLWTRPCILTGYNDCDYKTYYTDYWDAERGWYADLISGEDTIDEYMTLKPEQENLKPRNTWYDAYDEEYSDNYEESDCAVYYLDYTYAVDDTPGVFEKDERKGVFFPHYVRKFAVRNLIQDHSIKLPCKNGYYFSFALGVREFSTEEPKTVFHLTSLNYFSSVKFYDKNEIELFEITSTQIDTLNPSSMSSKQILNWGTTFAIEELDENDYLILVNLSVNEFRSRIEVDIDDGDEYISYADWANVLLRYQSGTLTYLGRAFSQNNIKRVDSLEAFENSVSSPVDYTAELISVDTPHA